MVVFGASGVVGRAATEHFAGSTDTATIGVSRRPVDVPGASHVAVDLSDEEASARAIAGPLFAGTTHVGLRCPAGVGGPRGWMAGPRVDGAQPAPVPARARPGGRRARRDARTREPPAGSQGLRVPSRPGASPGEGTSSPRRPRQLLLPAGGPAPRARCRRALVVDHRAATGRLRRVDRQPDESPPGDRRVRSNRTRARTSARVPRWSALGAGSRRCATPRRALAWAATATQARERDLQRDERGCVRLARGVADDRRLLRHGGR